MGISISNATSSAITKYSVSLRSGEPDWSMIPSAGKSNKSQAEFVSEIKELAQRQQRRALACLRLLWS